MAYLLDTHVILWALDDEYITEIERIGIVLLPIKKEYLDSYDQIPLLSDHRDPFDRLILATAFSEKFTIISADEKFVQYKNIIEVVW